MKNSNNHIVILFSGLLICLISSYLKYDLLMTENVLTKYYSEFLTPDLAEKGANVFRNYYWVFYLIALMSYTIKVVSISMVFYTSFKLFENKIQIYFIEIFSLVVLASFSFFFKDAFELIYFSFLKIDYNLKDLETTSFLSVKNLIPNNYLVELDFLFENLNIFQLVFCFLVALNFKKYFTNYQSSLSFVFKTYGVSLLAFSLFIIYLKLLFVPS